MMAWTLAAALLSGACNVGVMAMVTNLIGQAASPAVWMLGAFLALAAGRLITNFCAQLMLARASHPVEAAEEAILFYAYGRDVPAMHAELGAAGVAVSPITRPFYAPRGEFRVTDPDGYAIMITHND